MVVPALPGHPVPVVRPFALATAHPAVERDQSGAGAGAGTEGSVWAVLGSAPGLWPCLQHTRAFFKKQKLQKSQWLNRSSGAKQAWGILGLTNKGSLNGKGSWDQPSSWQSPGWEQQATNRDWGGLGDEPRKCLKDWKPAHCQKLRDLGVFSLTKTGLRRDWMESRNR